MIRIKFENIYFQSRVIKVVLLFITIIFVSSFSIYLSKLQKQGTGISNESNTGKFSNEKYPDLSNWKRPDGPIRVGLQAGHLKIDEVPLELAKIKNNGGTSANGLDEWQVNLSIANKTKKLLEEKGVVVDILPATIPTGYFADAFVAIHADGSDDYKASGFKVASPRRDMSGKANRLQQAISDTYGQITGLPKDPNITGNMTGYYAFSWRRFDHSLHPMTPATILETGFLTNPRDAKLLTQNSSVPAEAIADAVLQFLGIT